LSSAGEVSARTSLSTDSSETSDDYIGKYSIKDKDPKAKMPFRERMARRFGDSVRGII
jgi:hypothetical protein